MIELTDRTSRCAVGIDALDDMLGGGIPSGVIVDVFGRHGTGKTQMLLQAACRFAMYGERRRVLYVDTAGTFRPERIMEMAASHNNNNSTTVVQQHTSVRDVLDAISVARVQSVSEQMTLVEKLLYGGCPFDLVVIDSLTDLFSYEYSRYGDLREKSQKFFSHMRNLAKLAVQCGVTIMTSNMIRIFDDKEVENMAAEVDLFAHIKVHLISEKDTVAQKKQLYGYVSCAIYDSKQDKIATTCYDHNINSEKDADVIFSYEILESGIRTFEYGRVR